MLAELKLELLKARKTKNTLKADLLRTLIGELELDNKRTGKEITEKLIFGKIKKFLSSMSDLQEYRFSETVSLQQKELEGLLPVQLTEEEIRNIIVAQPNIGAAMKFMKDNYTGQYNPAIVAGLYNK